MKVNRTLWVAVLVGALALTGALVRVGAHEGEGPDPDPDQEPFIWMEHFGGTRLGISISDVTAEKAKQLNLPGEYGVVVEEVDEESPAAKAGMQKNDVILTFEGERVRSVAHLRRLVQETPAGRKVSLGVSRGGKTITVEVTPEERAVAMARPRRGIRVAPRIQVEPRIEMPEVPEVFEFELSSRPRLGISAEELTPQLAEYFGVKQGKGVLVREVMEGTAAQKAGLKAGDVIVRVDNDEVDDVGALREALRRERPTREVTLSIVRDRKEQTLKVTLDEPARRAPRRVAGTPRASADWQQWREDYQRALQDYRRSWQQEQKKLQEEMKQLRDQRRQLDKVQLRKAVERRQTI